MVGHKVVIVFSLRGHKLSSALSFCLQVLQSIKKIVEEIVSRTV